MSALEPQPQSLSSSRPSGGRSILWGAGTIVLLTILLLLFSPLASLLGPSKFALAHALHAVLAFVFVVAASFALYQAWQLFAGNLRPLAELRLVSYSMVLLSVFTVVFGNWLYVGYRDADPSSPKSFFLATTPAIHNVYFEFKEHVAIYCIPLSICAALILWRHGRQALENVWLRNAVASMIVLNFLYFVVAFGLGALITKLKGVP